MSLTINNQERQSPFAYAIYTTLNVKTNLAPPSLRSKIQFLTKYLVIFRKKITPRIYFDSSFAYLLNFTKNATVTNEISKYKIRELHPILTRERQLCRNHNLITYLNAKPKLNRRWTSVKINTIFLWELDGVHQLYAALSGKLQLTHCLNFINRQDH